MKYLFKHKIIIFLVYLAFITHSFGADIILPLPKPTPDDYTKSITIKKKEIYPQKRPETKTQLSESAFQAYNICR